MVALFPQASRYYGPVAASSDCSTHTRQARKLETPFVCACLSNRQDVPERCPKRSAIDFAVKTHLFSGVESSIQTGTDSQRQVKEKLMLNQNSQQDCVLKIMFWDSYLHRRHRKFDLHINFTQSAWATSAERFSFNFRTFDVWYLILFF